jgi:hypothetical protein
MRRQSLIRPAAIAVTTVAVLTGCGVQVEGGSSASSAAAPLPTTSLPATSPPTTSSPASGTPPSSTPAEPVGTSSGPMLQLDGVAEQGVEPGCVVFRTGGRQYLLLGAKVRVPMEVPIRVRGVVLTGVLSYCQQGTPLKVVEISRR